MKRLLFILLAVAVAACGKEDTTPDIPNTDEPNEAPTVSLTEKIVGEWHSQSLAADADIYISFAEDKTFELYQQIGEGSYRLYRGTWSLDEKTCILSGKYNDGEAWGTSYAAAIEGNTLTLTSTDASAEKSTYKSEEIPETVKSSCITVVKSAEAGF